MDNVDREVIKNINNYIKEYNLSVSKIAKEAGISYHQLWCLLTKRGSIRIGDYVAICRAVREPFDFFIPKK